MIEKILFEGYLLAIIVRAAYKAEGVEFFTPSFLGQQLGYINRPKGYVIKAHKHIIREQMISDYSEVLLLKSGKMKVNIFDVNDVFFTDKVLQQGDIILLCSGGHSFEMLETSELIEIKQGPYNTEEKVFLKANA